MAQWRPPEQKAKQITNQLGDGINTGVPPFEIKPSEATYLRNLSGQEYPAITTRYGRTNYSTDADFTITTPNGIGARNNNQLHVVDGNTWKYWNSTSFTDLTTALSSTGAEILDFNTGANRYTILMNSTQIKYWDGSSTALNITDASAPFTKLFAIHKGRVYAAKGATLYYSALNAITDWSTPNDAGSITLTGAKGDITGIIEYNDKIIVFTEYGMHELYGSGPSNFELIDIEGEVGCYSHKSITKVNRLLYFYWKDGIYVYNGSMPIKISSPVDEYIDNISYANRALVCGGSNSDILYMSIPHSDSSNNLILVYDTSLKKWYIETGNFKDFTNMDNKLYGITSTGGVKDIRNTSTDADDGTAISIDYITKPYVTGAGENKETLFDINMLYKGDSGATLSVYYSTLASNNDSTSFNSIAATSDFTFDGKEYSKKLLLPTTVLQDETFYRLRFTGTGDMTIYRLEQNYRYKVR